MSEQRGPDVQGVQSEAATTSSQDIVIIGKVIGYALLGGIILWGIWGDVSFAVKLAVACGTVALASLDIAISLKLRARRRMREAESPTGEILAEKVESETAEPRSLGASLWSDYSIRAVKIALIVGGAVLLLANVCLLIYLLMPEPFAWRGMARTAGIILLHLSFVGFLIYSWVRLILRLTRRGKSQEDSPFLEGGYFRLFIVLNAALIASILYGVPDRPILSIIRPALLFGWTIGIVALAAQDLSYFAPIGVILGTIIAIIKVRHLARTERASILVMLLVGIVIPALVLIGAWTVWGILDERAWSYLEQHPEMLDEFLSL
jgi:hypothetical protein